MGHLQYKEDKITVDCLHCLETGLAVPQSVDGVADCNSSADYILIVEKESVFLRLSDDGYCLNNNAIVITGKGYPDIATRNFVHFLDERLKLPIVILTDCDPYGIDIATVYHFGSLQMAFDAENLSTKSVQWIGMSLSDVDDFNLPQFCKLPLTARDKSKCKKLLQRSYFQKFAVSWQHEVEKMLEIGSKVEIEALAAKSLSFMADVYLPQKIRSTLQLE